MASEESEEYVVPSVLTPEELLELVGVGVRVGMERDEEVVEE